MKSSLLTVEQRAALASRVAAGRAQLVGAAALQLPSSDKTGLVQTPSEFARLRSSASPRTTPGKSPAPTGRIGARLELPAATVDGLLGGLGPDGRSAWVGAQSLLPKDNWGYLSANSYSAPVGRLYLVNSVGQINSACSGTLVAANLVLTAAHCVSGTFDFVFVPKQIGNSAPFGAFSARTATYYSYFDTVPGADGNPNFAPLDYALVVLDQPAGNSLGWYGLLANAPHGSYVFQTGYPAEGVWAPNCPFPALSANLSCYQWFSDSGTVDGYVEHYGANWWEMGIGGYVTGGSSGGPFFEYYNGNWYVASVVSNGPSIIVGGGRLGQNIWGPYLNDWALQLWAYAGTL